ncbi:MAG: hypothetical protein D6690_05305 [Nitrospirae bacterium]|nr:MAG: hypothetical protein D6690_05305 [Nitrospirota bacterium]
MAQVVANIGCAICAIVVCAIVLSITQNPGLWVAVFLVAMVPYLVVAMRIGRAGIIEISWLAGHSVDNGCCHDPGVVRFVCYRNSMDLATNEKGD